MKVMDELTGYGHRNIQGTHQTTLEITKADQVTLKGDCIIAVRASKATIDLDPSLKILLRKTGSKVKLTVEVNDLIDEVNGFGDAHLRLTSREEMVCRKSIFTCRRTLMVRSNKAAADMDRRIIEAMKSPRNKACITISAEY